jgi:predicted O-linked N-acetylglucosamine transferase (SPINDLY family)
VTVGALRSPREKKREKNTHFCFQAVARQRKKSAIKEQTAESLKEKKKKKEKKKRMKLICFSSASLRRDAVCFFLSRVSAYGYEL